MNYRRCIAMILVFAYLLLPLVSLAYSQPAFSNVRLDSAAASEISSRRSVASNPASEHQWSDDDADFDCDGDMDCSLLVSPSTGLANLPTTVSPATPGPVLRFPQVYLAIVLPPPSNY